MAEYCTSLNTTFIDACFVINAWSRLTIDGLNVRRISLLISFDVDYSGFIDWRHAATI